MEHRSDHRALRKIGMLGNHSPRQCGIATFTTDLSDAIAAARDGTECVVLAMNDAGKHHAYPPRVRFEIAESEVSSYRRAADFLNVNTVDVLSVQHEYGIFGGKAGAYLLGLLRELRMPVVTTLHTILAEPNPQQRAVMDALCTLSERLVVMSQKGADLLHSVHGVARDKIDFIPHGIPSVPHAAGSKDQLGVQGKSVILTFGLLSPDKGIEHAIDALPRILESFPDTVYIVLGATHPHIREREGEAYRLMLESRAQRLGVGGSIIFHNRFVSPEELSEFLAGADIYITPYLKPEQITSGTLAYAVGAGKAVISTPYWYAEELLADGRGVLVPWRDAGAIAREVIALLGDDASRFAMQKRAASYGRQMTWPAVANSYIQSFQRAQVDHARRARKVFQAKTLGHRAAELPDLNLEHLQLMTDDTGLLQHAWFNVPRYVDGYCLDDNARALLLTAYVEESGAASPDIVRAMASRYMAFVSHAFNDEIGRFRNFMSYDRKWLEECGSEDSHGRTLWALGAVIGRSSNPGRQSLAGRLFHAALPALADLKSPRAWAYALLGIDEYLRAFEGDIDVQSVRQNLAARLMDIYRRTSAPGWHWFEESVTYCNARLPEALIVSGAAMHDVDMVDAGLQSLAWLAAVQRTSDGYFAPVGSNGFYVRSQEKAPFDQQPVEACAMVSACAAAARVTGNPEWVSLGTAAFDWFLGHNHLQKMLYDPSTGACRDGLHSDRVNENRGAESSLSFLLSLFEMRRMDRATLGLPPAKEAALS